MNGTIECHNKKTDKPPAIDSDSDSDVYSCYGHSTTNGLLILWEEFILG